MRLEAATQQEAEAAAALEEADKKLLALKADCEKTKDFEELEAQHVQVGNMCSPLHPCHASVIEVQISLDIHTPAKALTLPKGDVAADNEMSRWG